jgi:hypothetical protein
MGGKVLFVLGWLLVSIAVPDGLNASDVQTKSFPVPVRIDFGQCLQTSLYVKCKFIEYNLSYPQFATEETGKAERAFQRVISAIRGKDPVTCLDLCSGTGGLKSEEEQLYTKNVNSLIKSFADNVLDEHLNELRIDIQYYIGDTQLFIWGLNNPPGRPTAFRTWMKFHRNSTNELLWEPQIGRLDDFSELLMCIMRQRARTEKEFKAVEKQGFTYELAIPGTIEGDTAYLQFNGKVYDCNIFEDSVDPNDEIMSFYQGAYHVLRDRSIEDFVQLYTSKSRENYMEWLTGKYKDYAKWYHEDLIKSGRKVVFILDAKPFYFVFYRKNHSRDKAIRFADVVRDPTDNKLKLTNFNYFDYVHEFLNSKELFINPMLKPLLTGKSE